MRIALLALALAACSRQAGPRWPQRETPAIDGGESLAPHMARSIAAAAVEEDKPVPVAAVVTGGVSLATCRPGGISCVASVMASFPTDIPR